MSKSSGSRRTRSTGRAWALVFSLGGCAGGGSAPGPEAGDTDGAVEPAPLELDLWKGVPPIVPVEHERDAISPYAGPAKPTRFGETIDAPFPPPAPPPAGATPAVTGPLEVERFGPTGAQTLVDAIRIGFSQPMVPLTSVDALSMRDAPASITPEVPGEWRWHGTKTVAFYPEGRLPFSTEYRVRVPAGVESTLGNALEDEVAFSLRTPTVAIASARPYDGANQVRMDTPIVLRFNQPVDEDAIAGALTLRGSGPAVPLELVARSTWGEISDAPVSASADEWEQRRWILLRPTRKLAPNTTYTLRLGGGMFGEGPLPSKPSTSKFTTYPPLRFARWTCDWGTCPANRDQVIRATTPIDGASAASRVTVTPEVANLEVNAGGRSSREYRGGIRLTGDFEGEQTYTVRIDAGVRDTFGQSLAAPFVTKMSLGPISPRLEIDPPPSETIILERSQVADVGVRVEGIRELQLRSRSYDVDELVTFAHPGWTNHWGWPTGLPDATRRSTVDVQESRRRGIKHRIALDPLLEKGDSFLYLRGRSEDVRPEPDREQRVGFAAAIQVTDLGVVSSFDRDDGLVFVTRLSNGRPVEGAKVRLMRDYGDVITEGVTAEDGTVTLNRDEQTTPRWLVVEHEDDATAVRAQVSSWSASEDQTDRVFFFTERKPYKPGETIHVAGIVRRDTRGPDGGVGPTLRGATARYRVNAPVSGEVARGEVAIGELGTFTLDVETNDDAELGDYELLLTVPRFVGRGEEHRFTFPVEAYRTPEFTVEVARNESTPLFFGDELEVEVRGQYLFGSPLIGGEVRWSLQRSNAGFRPPGRENAAFDFAVGGGGRGFYGGRGGLGMFGSGFGTGLGFGLGPHEQESGTGTLDDRGRWVLRHPLLAHPNAVEGVEPDPKDKTEDVVAATYTVTATVTDENRQSIQGEANFVVHPTSAYVGVRLGQSVVREGERTSAEAIVTNLEGERIEGTPITVELVRQETTRSAKKIDGRWRFEYDTVDHVVETCELVSAARAVECPLQPTDAGSHQLRARIKDPEGRVARADATLYVHGDDAVIWAKPDRRVELVVDKDEYEPGDTAQLLVRSPFQEGWAILTLAREGAIARHTVPIAGGTAVLAIPIEASMMPGIEVDAVLTRHRVEVEGAPEGQDLGIPAAAKGSLRIPVSTATKTIDVAVSPSTTVVHPGGHISVDVDTTVTGAPVGAQVALFVVDEGVLSLMGYETPDPMAFFHRTRGAEVSSAATHAFVLPRDEPIAIAPEPDPPPDTVPQRGALGAPADASSLSPYGGAFAVGNDDEDVWGGLTGTEVGEAYGVGGLGLVGTGRGGGGTGEGTIGLGNTGLIGKGGGGGKGSGYGRGSGAGFASRSSATARTTPKDAPPGAAALTADRAMLQDVKLRRLFATTAFFDPAVRTDASGHATVEIDMPENLTTFRIMAVAVDASEADRFGSGEASVRVRKPIMLRPSMPRFANVGDAFEAAVMVDNQTTAPQHVRVGLRGVNIELPGETERDIELGPGESTEVRFPARSSEAGTMQVQFAALSNEGRDATEVDLPVLIPATRQAFADYGSTESSVLRKLDIPQNVVPQFGGLELSFSSTALNGLEDSVKYLVTYPYECAEQTASRVLPIYALGDVLDSFPIANVADRETRKTLSKQGVDRLVGRQNSDGGFRYWDKGKSNPYLSAWVTFTLLEGKRAGFEVPASTVEKAKSYLESFVRFGDTTEWGRYYAWTSRAFALWVISGEDAGSDAFDIVWAERKRLPLYAKALLMSAAHRYGRTAERDEILATLRESVVENARTIHFSEVRSEASAEGLRLLMHSNVQTDAIALITLLEVAPKDPMLPKVIAGIMDDRDPRRGGRWRSTHANGWALVAASRWFETAEADDPDFTARTWIDDRFAGEHEFSGRSMAKINQVIPMRALAETPGERDLVVSKDGPGRLYYRLGLRYAEKDAQVEAVDRGFVVTRTYTQIPELGEDVDPDAVKREASGDWVVKAGTNVRVDLTLVASDRAYYVVVDDPLPAGFEGQNPRFKTSVGASGTGQVARRWWYPWYAFDHTQMRDERMVLFADRLNAGVYTYSYTARATTIGEFVLPPVHAEEMYAPERFGHGASAKVTVVP